MNVQRAVYLGAVCTLLIAGWAWASAMAGFPVSVHTLPLLVVLMVGLVGFAALQFPLPGLRRARQSLPNSTCPPIRRALLELVGKKEFVTWFNALEFESTDGRTIQLSVPVPYLKTHIETHHAHVVLHACRTVFPELMSVVIIVRKAGAPHVDA